MDAGYPMALEKCSRGRHQADGREGTGACHQATHKGYKACLS
ncbi:hypothetical protein [Sharpea azabuensis]|nr:hypothetical protein [Sharpea azabuensis]